MSVYNVTEIDAMIQRNTWGISRIHELTRINKMVKVIIANWNSLVPSLYASMTSCKSPGMQHPRCWDIQL